MWLTWAVAITSCGVSAMPRTVDQIVRWHIKYQFEELAKAIEERAATYSTPEAADAICEIAIVIRQQADDIHGVDPT